MPIKRLVIIRPGETDWNLNGRWQGWVAAPINELGVQQMQRLAGFVRHIGMSKLYSSDLERARQSAEILTDALGFTPIYDERLRERSIGVFQGLTVPEIHGWYHDAYRQLLADPEGYRIPGGESLDDVLTRVRGALDDIIAAADEQADPLTVGVLSHTTTIRMIFKHIAPHIDLTTTSFANSSVTTLIREGNAWRLTAANDLMHLEGLESRVMPADVQGDDPL